MYVTDIFNALNNYPHQLHFEPVRDVDSVRRHNWSPGYYEDADAALDHHPDAYADNAPTAAAPATPEQARDEKNKEQAADGELAMADA